jgi:hypothetical protein
MISNMPKKLGYTIAYWFQLQPKGRQGINSLSNSESGGGRVYLTCLQALRLLANPPLQLIANGARSQFQPTFAISQGFEPLAVVGDTTLLLVAIL